MVAQLLRRRLVPGGRGDASQRVQREDLDVGFVVPARVLEDRVELVNRTGYAVDCVDRGEQALPERVLLATAHGVVPRAGRFEHGAGVGGATERAQDAAEVHARECCQAHVARRLGLLDRELQRPGAVS